MWTMELRDAADTHRAGEALSRAAQGPTVVALVGDLGAGKTCFAQGVGAGLLVEQPIVSPTFVLVAQYEGRLDLLHADIYRLEPHELPSIGLEETIEDWPGVVLVEWADRCPGLLPQDHLRVVIEHQPEGRKLTAQAMGPRHAEVLQRWVTEAQGG